MNRFLLILLLLSIPALLQAQPLHFSETESQNYTQANPRLETHLGYLLQHQFYYLGESERGRQLGFALPRARLRLNGAWDQQYKIFVQVDFARPVSILDARLTIPVSEGVVINAGLFKTPFSREFLLFGGDLPLIERSRVVRALAPDRQVGASLRIQFLEERLTFEGGVYNGNGATLESNNNNRFLVASRLNWSTPLPVGGVQIGINAAYSEDSSLNIPVVGVSNGERILVGADGEVILENWLIRGEIIAASFGEGSSVDAAYGYVGTIGYKLFPAHQIFASYDVLDPGFDLGEHAVFGYKIYLSEAVLVQANYRLPLDDPKGSEAVLRIQLAVR